MAYCTAANVMAYLALYNVPETFIDETKLTASGFLDRAKSTIDSYCFRDFDHHVDAIEFYHGSGKDYLQTYQFPILKITHVIMYNQLLQAMRMFLDTELIVHPQRGQIYLPPIYPAFLVDKPYAAVFGNIFIPGRYNIEVQYDYGYATPPLGVVTANILLTVADVLRAYQFDLSRGRSSMGSVGVSESYSGLIDKQVEQIKKEAFDLLNRERRVFMRSV